MLIGILKEIKEGEYRVSIVPAGVKTLVDAGHRVLVEKKAGEESGISDEDFIRAGAEVRESNKEIWDEAEMIMKVKEPLPQEYDLMHEGQIIFTYFHLAPERKLTNALLERKVVGIAYETIELDDGTLPLLTPMSEIAGRMAVHVGAYFLQKEHNGRGVLLGGVPGVEPANVVILGGGVVGTNAAKIAFGMGADVTVLDIDLNRLRYLDDIYFGRMKTLMSNSQNVGEAVVAADLLIGGILIHGARTPHLVTRDMVSSMRKGAVIVDVAVDQGGCVETTRPTFHDNPTFEVDGVIHYCVANMPGAVARTSTFALTNTTFPYCLKMANMGYREAMRSDKALMRGLNAYDGKVTYKPVAEALNLEYLQVEF
ncbi:MAG: alanine dehydrogenase [Syntrophobacterales bacterium]|nr:MAG: alanine dehydrogenase [Syntrophobacterales bacterium]